MFLLLVMAHQRIKFGCIRCGSEDTRCIFLWKFKPLSWLSNNNPNSSMWNVIGNLAQASSLTAKCSAVQTTLNFLKVFITAVTLTLETAIKITLHHYSKFGCKQLWMFVLDILWGIKPCDRHSTYMLHCRVWDNATPAQQVRGEQVQWFRS